MRIRRWFYKSILVEESIYSVERRAQKALPQKYCKAWKTERNIVPRPSNFIIRAQATAKKNPIHKSFNNPLKHLKKAHVLLCSSIPTDAILGRKKARARNKAAPGKAFKSIILESSITVMKNSRLKLISKGAENSLQNSPNSKIEKNKPFF